MVFIPEGPWDLREAEVLQARERARNIRISSGLAKLNKRDHLLLTQSHSNIDEDWSDEIWAIFK